MPEAIGLCKCGCGEPTRAARHGEVRPDGTHYRRGDYREYIRGHAANALRRIDFDSQTRREERGHETPCLVWVGKQTTPNGYGYHRGQVAHRFNWERLVGPIPPGLELDHLCRQRDCVEITHLEPVTQAENVRRGSGVLTHADAADLRRLRTLYPRRLPEGMRAILLEQYGVSAATLCRAWRGSTWQ